MNEKNKILKIALDVPLDKFFDYLNNESNISIGQYVKVPFGKRTLIGVVCGFAKSSIVPVDKLKQIISVEKEVICDENLLELLTFSSSYYHHPIGQAILSIVPSRIKNEKNSPLKKEMIYKATKKLTQDWIKTNITKRQKTKIKLLSALLIQPLIQSKLKTIASNASQVILELESLGLCIAEEYIPKNNHHKDEIPPLNVEQKKVLEKLSRKDTFIPWLLHGVTGSGKTEIYLNLIKKYIEKKGNQILVLVPEINLTPQLENRFRMRFPNKKVVILHSNINESQRLKNWRLAKSGEAQIILGTRLAIFTPIKNLRFIIIDEEHDASFKQQEGFKYHARDVAMVRARNQNIPILMGTATPSLESWFNAKLKNDKYKLLQLNNRAVKNSSLPSIKIIPKSDFNSNSISPLIIKAIESRIERKEQSLIFINRRGYAPVLVCGSCGWSANCKRCSSRLVFHRKQKKMKCHHCDYERNIDFQCESCGNTDLHPLGAGTQRVEEVIQKLLPKASITRVDRDSMRKKNALTEFLEKMCRGEVDILVGTQMLAKGHDFPKLTLVVVIDADNALYSTDLRASERLFSQLLQVSGRAGRSNLKGEVYIETSFPNHPIFQAVKSQNYDTFADNLLQEREPLDLPPFSYSAILKAESKKLALVESFTSDIVRWGEQNKNSVSIYGPVRPAMERIKGFERIHIYIQSSERKKIQDMLNVWIDQIRRHPLANKIKWSIDVDPI